MASTNKNTEPEASVASPEVSLAEALSAEPEVIQEDATAKERTDVLKEFRETGRVRPGFVYSRAFPELVRRQKRA